MQTYDWAWRLLQTLPGIDQLAACLILIEIGDDLSQFGSADRFAPWAAVCPGNHESAGKRKTGKTRKGNNVAKNAPRWIKALKQYGYWPQVVATT